MKGGTFSALGRRFSIDEAKITETGGDIADPELEIQARYENAQASVLVLVSGTAKDPQIDLSSSPPMDQDSIAFFLADRQNSRVKGDSEQGSGVDLGNAATSVLGAMLFGKLRSNMADIMPVDVIDIEAGGGDRPPEASVGKYIGDRIFVGYRQRFSPAPTENENEVTVEYARSERGLGTSATVGDKNQGVDGDLDQVTSLMRGRASRFRADHSSRSGSAEGLFLILAKERRGRPLIEDEFAYLFQAQTLARGHLSFPSPPLPEFFEVPRTCSITPRSAAKYLPGHALLLAPNFKRSVRRRICTSLSSWDCSPR